MNFITKHSQKNLENSWVHEKVKRKLKDMKYRGARFFVNEWGGISSSTLLKLVEARLAEFVNSINLDDIAFVTAGASIMAKLGCVTSCKQVICLDHTIHIFLCDVLNMKKKKNNGEEEQDIKEEEAGDNVVDEIESGADTSEDNDATVLHSLSDSKNGQHSRTF